MSLLEGSSRRRRRRIPRTLLAVAAAVLAFLVGLALGEAIEERPQPGGTVTTVRTIETVTQTVTETQP